MKTTHVPNSSAADGSPVYLVAVPVVGSPQGVIAGVPGLLAVDTTTGNIWAKQTGTGNTGWALSSGGVGGGTGTVTSVAFAGDGTVFSSASGTPVTSSGNLSPTLKAQNPNLFLLGPISGGPSNPTFRLFDSTDFSSALAPTISGANMGNSANQLTGIMPICNAPANLYTGGSQVSEGITIFQLDTGFTETQAYMPPTNNSPSVIENGALFFIKYSSTSQSGTILVINPNLGDSPQPTFDTSPNLLLTSAGDYVILFYWSGVFYIMSINTN